MSIKKFEPTWSSLKKHKTPEWLDDAKFGIYFHWGVYSVPAFGNEWYPGRMYRKGTKIYKYHKKTYGDPSKFGYKDFIPKFTAENFDPDEWAELFKKTGAKFAGPVAEHHDGFSMWKSKVNPWNAYDMGPKKDIVGEMEKAIRKQNMKFITTFHHSHNWYYYLHSKDYDTGDPKYSQLYGHMHNLDLKKLKLRIQNERPDKEFCENWFAKLKEVIDNYRPDLIWFDFGLKRIPDNYKRKMAAYYYNKALEWDTKVEIIYKYNDLPPGVGLLDYERGRSDKMTYHKWITDTILGTKSWSYVKNEVYKPISTLIHNFTDRIAKNGLLLLNFGPTAQGDIPNEVRERLLELSNWIDVNKEAIFNSTPWILAEEGPTKMKRTGGFSEHREVSYSSKDLRFVTKDDALYVFSLGLPEKEITIKSLANPIKYRKFWNKPWLQYLVEEADIKSIHLLGHPYPLKWQLTVDGLKIEIPDKKPCDHAVTFKIQWAD